MLGVVDRTVKASQAPIFKEHWVDPDAKQRKRDLKAERKAAKVAEGTYRWNMKWTNCDVCGAKLRNKHLNKHTKKNCKSEKCTYCGQAQS